MRNEGLLDRVEIIALCQSLDRGDLCSLVTDREGKAGIDPPSVDQNRAGPTLAAIAPLLGSRQIEALPKEVEKGDPWIIEQCAPLDSVHDQLDQKLIRFSVFFASIPPRMSI